MSAKKESSTTTSQTTKRILPRDQEQLVNGFPKELTEQFQPLYCALCEVKMSSNKTAFMHYNSKNHKRKVNHYLEEWSIRTGEPMPKKLCLVQPDETEKLHCEACNLPLTSRQHAQQHYMGKQHQKVIAGKREPSGFGFYDKDGKWQRMHAKPDKTGRFGIGTAFLKKDNPDSTLGNKQNTGSSMKYPIDTFEIMENKMKRAASELLKRADDFLYRGTPVAPDETDTQKPKMPTSVPSTYNMTPMAPTVPTEEEIRTNEEIKANVSLHCGLCQISVTSISQMDAHKNGAKHLKKMRQAGFDVQKLNTNQKQKFHNN